MQTRLLKDAFGWGFLQWLVGLRTRDSPQYFTLVGLIWLLIAVARHDARGRLATAHGSCYFEQLRHRVAVGIAASRCGSIGWPQLAQNP